MMPIFLMILVSIFLGKAEQQEEKFITLEFDRLELLNQGWNNRKFYFKINDTVISPDTGIFNVKTDIYPLDQISFSFDSTFKNMTPVYAKFRAGNSYTIRINSCSQYELIANENPMLGQVRFKKIETKMELYGGLCQTEILTKATTKYYETCQSAMCQYAPVEISVSNNDSIVDYTLFHFLHGEKLTATFNGGVNKIELSVDYLK